MSFYLKKTGHAHSESFALISFYLDTQFTGTWEIVAGLEGSWVRESPIVRYLRHNDGTVEMISSFAKYVMNSSNYNISRNVTCFCLIDSLWDDIVVDVQDRISLMMNVTFFTMFLKGKKTIFMLNLRGSFTILFNVNLLAFDTCILKY